MTLEELTDKVRQWDLENTGVQVADAKYACIFDQLSYHASKEWRVYLPTEHTDLNPSYLERLAAWIGNVTNEAEQKLLFEYALRISFFSRDDFAALYRTALNREVVRWVASQVNARLDNGGGSAFDTLIHQEIHSHTWFCPITDSMDINEFCKVNHLRGAGHRPGFATLQLLAEKAGTPNPGLAQNLINYMANPGGNRRSSVPPLKRLVLLEDIVGSASQCLDSIRWAVANLDKPVLFIPLILCPKGVEALRAEEAQWNGRLTIRPVIGLRRADLLGPERNGEQGWAISSQLEALARRCKTDGKISGNPFGFKGTGCSLSTFSNCPNNTIPLVHRTKRGAWNALFPRVSRET